MSHHPSLASVPCSSSRRPVRSATRAATVPRCPVEATLDVLGGPWRALLVWHLFWGARPFCELMRHTAGISKKALRWELAEMERQGLVRKEVRPGANRKAEYSLTPRGVTLKPIVGAMYEWGLHDMARPRPAAPLSWCGRPRWPPCPPDRTSNGLDLSSV